LDDITIRDFFAKDYTPDLDFDEMQLLTGRPAPKSKLDCLKYKMEAIATASFMFAEAMMNARREAISDNTDLELLTREDGSGSVNPGSSGSD